MRRIAITVLLISLLTSMSAIAFSIQPVNTLSGAFDVGLENSSAFAPSYENVTIHEGDLVINGTQTYLIENCIYRINGSIHIEELGKLLTRDAMLIIEQNYDFQHFLHVKDFAQLETRNITIYSNFALEIRLESHAQGSLINTTIMEYATIDCIDDSTLNVMNSTLIEIGNHDRSTLIITGSEILWNLNLWFQHLAEVAHLDHVRPGFYRYWSLNENQSTSNVLHDLILMNTSVLGWAISIDYGTITLSNSELSSIGCGFTNRNVTVDGAHLGVVYSNWTLGELTLLNTSVTGHWGFAFENCLAEISNVTAGIFLHSHSNVSITNSTISIDAYYFTNGAIQLQDTKIYGLEVLGSTFYIHGDINFTSDLSIRHVIDSNITRNYDIVIMNGTSVPVSDVELSLYDENGTAVWNGATDSLGKASFNVTFSDSNYTDTLSLEAVKGYLSVVENISFISDTPVILTFGAHDVAVVEVAVSKTAVGQHYSTFINVTVANQGDFVETFNVTISINQTITVTLPPSSQTTLTFVWNTTDVPYGNYTISAYAEQVPDEVDISDNTYTTWIVVTIPGDVDGDGEVSIFDIVNIALIYGAEEGDPDYNPNCDLDGDGDIDIFDIVIACNHYGESW